MASPRDPKASRRDPKASRRGERLDERVVREGLAESRSGAQALILSGRVLVDDVPVDKSGARVTADRAVRRGGL